MSNPPTLDYRTPTTDCDPVEAYLAASSRRTLAGAAAGVVAGTVLVLLIGAGFATFACDVFLRFAHPLAHHWWLWFGAYLALVVPALLVYAKRRRSGSFGDVVLNSGWFDGTRAASSGEYEMRRSIVSISLLTDVVLWGPRVFVDGIEMLLGRGGALVPSATLKRGAGVLRTLLAKPDAMGRRALLQEGEDAARLAGVLHWLDARGHIGLSSDGQRVWLSTPCRTTLTRQLKLNRPVRMTQSR
ncbi:MAG: hypothetical protein QM770_19510 [Tepidisphaeraceae bacterium]